MWKTMSNFYQVSKIQRKIFAVLSAELNAERLVLSAELSGNIFGILSAELSAERQYPLSAELSAERAFLLNDSCSDQMSQSQIYFRFLLLSANSDQLQKTLKDTLISDDVNECETEITFIFALCILIALFSFSRSFFQSVLKSVFPLGNVRKLRNGR